jgi:hypothetical protein
MIRDGMQYITLWSLWYEVIFLNLHAPRIKMMIKG